MAPDQVFASHLPHTQVKMMELQSLDREIFNWLKVQTPTWLSQVLKGFVKKKKKERCDKLNLVLKNHSL